MPSHRSRLFSPNRRIHDRAPLGLGGQRLAAFVVGAALFALADLGRRKLALARPDDCERLIGHSVAEHDRLALAISDLLRFTAGVGGRHEADVVVSGRKHDGGPARPVAFWLASVGRPSTDMQRTFQLVPAADNVGRPGTARRYLPTNTAVSYHSRRSSFGNIGL
jgi:hypothetical protein